MINLDDLVTKIRLDDSDVDRATANTSTQLGRLGAAAGVGRRQFTELSQGTRLTRQEMLALNYTVSDVAASLASGASPFTILLQQGGQVRDAFGGLGNVFSKLGAAITVGRVAIAGGTAAVGLLSYAFIQGVRDSDSFEKAIQRSGNVAGITESEYRKLAGTVATATGATVGSSREILQALITTGRFGPQALESVAKAAASMSKAFDMSEADAVKALTGMADGVSKWAAQHNKSTNYITIEQYKYIRALEEQGRVQDAIVYNSKLVDEANQRVTKNLGLLESAWNGIKKTASEAWDAMLNIGRRSTLEEQIELTRRRLEMAQRAADDPATIGPYGGLRKSGRERIEQLQEELRLLNRSQVARRETLDTNSARAIADAKAVADAERDRNKTPKRPVDAFNEAQNQLEERIRTGLDRVADSELDATAKANQKRNEDYARRTSQAADFGQQLLDQAATVNASLIQDDEARGQAILAIEKAQLSARIDALGLAQMERAVLEDKAAQFVLAREKQLTEELKPEWQRRLEQWADLHSDMKARHAEFVKGFIDQGRSAFMDFVETGKLSTRGLLAFMRSEFARLFYERYLAKAVSGFASSLFNFFTGEAITGKAAGGPVQRGGLYEVNERGTEVLSIGGRDFLMMGAESGNVKPASSTGWGGDGMQLVIAPVFHGGVSRNELMAGMQVAADIAVTRVAEARRRRSAAFTF